MMDFQDLPRGAKFVFSSGRERNTPGWNTPGNTQCVKIAAQAYRRITDGARFSVNNALVEVFPVKTRRTVTVGETVTVELPWSEVCMHLRVAGKVRRVVVLDTAAQILDRDGRPFSAPITHGEAGLIVRYQPLAIEADVIESVEE